MPKYAIRTQGDNWCVYRETEIDPAEYGAIFEVVEAGSPGQARYIFTRDNCDGEFTAALWIRRAHDRTCAHCGSTYVYHRSFPGSDYEYPDPRLCDECSVEEWYKNEQE